MTAWPPSYEGLALVVLDPKDRALGEALIPGRIPVRAGDTIVFQDVEVPIVHEGRLHRLAVRIPQGPFRGLHEAPGETPSHYMWEGDSVSLNGHVDFLPPILERPW